MRLLSGLVIWLGLIAACLSVAWYVHIQKLGCAMGGTGQTCALQAPWQLGREDFVILFAIPVLITAAILALGYRLRRLSKNQ